MDYPLDVPNFTNKPLTLRVSQFGKPKLIQDDEVAPRGEEPLDRIVVDDHGREVVATFKARMGGLDYPVIVIKGNRYKPTDAIPGEEITAGVAPMLLALWFAIPGAVMGVAAVMINYPILRSGKPKWQRGLMIAVVFFLALAGSRVLTGILEAR